MKCDNSGCEVINELGFCPLLWWRWLPFDTHLTLTRRGAVACSRIGSKDCCHCATCNNQRDQRKLSGSSGGSFIDNSICLSTQRLHWRQHRPLHSMMLVVPLLFLSWLGWVVLLVLPNLLKAWDPFQNTLSIRAIATTNQHFSLIVYFSLLNPTLHTSTYGYVHQCMGCSILINFFNHIHLCSRILAVNPRSTFMGHTL